MNIPLLAGAAFAIFSIYLLRHAITNYKSALASQSWPSVNGRLTDVRLWGKRRINGEMKDAEKLIVEYEYEINGLKYTGTSATFHTLVYPETLEFSKRHSKDSEVRVYYNPKNFVESVLIPGLKKDQPYSEFILGGFGFALGVVIAALGGTGIIG